MKQLTDSNPQNSLRSQRGEMQRLKGFSMKTVLKTGVISFQIGSLVHYFQTTTLHLFHLIGQFFLSTASLREVITFCLHFPCLLPWEQYQLQIQIYDLAKRRDLKKADKEWLGQTRYSRDQQQKCQGKCWRRGERDLNGSAQKHVLMCVQRHIQWTSTLVQSNGSKRHIAVYPSRKNRDSLGHVTHILLTVPTAQSSVLSLWLQKT